MQRTLRLELTRGDTLSETFLVFADEDGLIPVDLSEATLAAAARHQANAESWPLSAALGGADDLNDVVVTGTTTGRTPGVWDVSITITESGAVRTQRDLEILLLEEL